MGYVVILLFVMVPFVLTGWNIFTLVQYLVTKKEKKYTKGIELLAVCIGLFYLYLYTTLFEITFSNWDVRLYSTQMHSMIAPDAFATVGTISLVGFVGYLVIRFIPASKLPPVVSALGLAAVYLEIGLCVLWCIQTFHDFFLVLFSANCILLWIKAIYHFITQKSTQWEQGESSSKQKGLSKLLHSAGRLPWTALLLAVPLLGILAAVLTLFGQEPDSIIKAWTETADWTLSQKTAPQNIDYNGHYLCTVAAGGHRKVVKPLRTGSRHGRRIVVNRQLCIANAFEQVLEEKTPAFHKLVRSIYDRTGYPLSKHIHSKYLADGIYFLMKPLEWFFLIVLYTVDVKPENRIAVQYPHAPPPRIPAKNMRRP